MVLYIYFMKIFRKKATVVSGDVKMCTFHDGNNNLFLLFLRKGKEKFTIFMGTLKYTT